jgi:hypothetical protein
MAAGIVPRGKNNKNRWSIFIAGLGVEPFPFMVVAMSSTMCVPVTRCQLFGKAGYCFDGHIDLHPSITRMRVQHRLYADEGASEDDYEEITCQACAGVPAYRPVR